MAHEGAGAVKFQRRPLIVSDQDIRNNFDELCQKTGNFIKIIALMIQFKLWDLEEAATTNGLTEYKQNIILYNTFINKGTKELTEILERSNNGHIIEIFERNPSTSVDHDGPHNTQEVHNGSSPSVPEDPEQGRRTIPNDPPKKLAKCWSRHPKLLFALVSTLLMALTGTTVYTIMNKHDKNLIDENVKSFEMSEDMKQLPLDNPHNVTVVNLTQFKILDSKLLEVLVLALPKRELLISQPNNNLDGWERNFVQTFTIIRAMTLDWLLYFLEVFKHIEILEINLSEICCDSEVKEFNVSREFEFNKLKKLQITNLYYDCPVLSFLLESHMINLEEFWIMQSDLHVNVFDKIMEFVKRHPKLKNPKNVIFSQNYISNEVDFDEGQFNGTEFQNDGQRSWPWINSTSIF